MLKKPETSGLVSWWYLWGRQSPDLIIYILVQCLLVKFPFLTFCVKLMLLLSRWSYRKMWWSIYFALHSMSNLRYPQKKYVQLVSLHIRLSSRCQVLKYELSITSVLTSIFDSANPCFFRWAKHSTLHGVASRIQSSCSPLASGHLLDSYGSHGPFTSWIYLLKMVIFHIFSDTPKYHVAANISTCTYIVIVQIILIVTIHHNGNNSNSHKTTKQ